MSDKDSLTLSNDELPLPETAEGILSVVRGVLNKPFVQKITLSQGSPIQVSWYRDISDRLDVQEPEESPESVLSRVELEEITGDFNGKELVVDGMMLVSSKGEYPSHLLVGNIKSFKDCLGIPQLVPIPTLDGTSYKNFMGIPLIEVPSLHKDSIVLLSANVRNASLSETKSGLKLSL